MDTMKGVNIMKTAFAVLTALTLAASAFAAPEVGKPAPGFTGTDINGKTVKLSDYAGKIVVIESYNSDCPYCHNQYKTGAMQALQKDLAAQGVVWLLVNSVNPKNMSHRTPEQARAEMAAEKILQFDRPAGFLAKARIAAFRNQTSETEALLRKAAQAQPPSYRAQIELAQF